MTTTRNLLNWLYWWVDERGWAWILCGLGIHKRYQFDFAQQGDRKGKCIRCSNWKRAGETRRNLLFLFAYVAGLAVIWIAGR